MIKKSTVITEAPINESSDSNPSHTGQNTPETSKANGEDGGKTEAGSHKKL